jgi:peptidyl-tRNA hydrolase, PTH1 family
MDAVFEKNWLIVGLGNPGSEYDGTRHNLGFMVADAIAKDSGTKIDRSECQSLMGRVRLGEMVVELAKPQTYMNLSGEAVKCLLKKEDRSRQHMIVISDDLALPLGRLRIRPAGSHGGHNGLRSIIDCLGTQDFVRLRIGIMPDHPVANSRDFVLRKFAKSELGIANEMVEEAADAVAAIIIEGTERAMAGFN